MLYVSILQAFLYKLDKSAQRFTNPQTKENRLIFSHNYLIISAKHKRKNNYKITFVQFVRKFGMKNIFFQKFLFNQYK